jgi:DNA phosphorothioation-associated putative methyltransferase
MTGKQLPDALYIHISALGSLDPEIADVVRQHAGQGYHVAKIDNDGSHISYLTYGSFSSNPHPPLEFSRRVDLSTGKATYHNYGRSNNPPILHRKELLLEKGHPLYKKFSALTQQELAAGLLDSPQIGRRKGWTKLLRRKGYRLSGHTLVKR